MIHLARVFLAFLMSVIVYSQDKGSTIEVEIVGIDNTHGELRIGLYDAKDNWLKKVKMATTGEISNGTCTITFEDVSNGIYAISLFHDENSNGKLDTNFLGIPKEDTGASNNAPANFGPPKWEDAKFEVKGETIKQIINL